MVKMEEVHTLAPLLPQSVRFLLLHPWGMRQSEPSTYILPFTACSAAVSRGSGHSPSPSWRCCHHSHSPLFLAQAQGLSLLSASPFKVEVPFQASRVWLLHHIGPLTQIQDQTPCSKSPFPLLWTPSLQNPVSSLLVILWVQHLARQMQEVTLAITVFLGFCQNLSTRPLKSLGQAMTDFHSLPICLLISSLTPFFSSTPVQTKGPLQLLPRGNSLFFFFLSFSSICFLLIMDLTSHSSGFLSFFLYFNLSVECLGYSVYWVPDTCWVLLPVRSSGVCRTDRPSPPSPAQPGNPVVSMQLHLLSLLPCEASRSGPCNVRRAS